MRLPAKGWPDWLDWALPANDCGRNYWFWVDIPAMAKCGGLDRVLPFIVDAGRAANPGGYPLGGVTRTALPNDHLQYAITWFALAGVARRHLSSSTIASAATQESRRHDRATPISRSAFAGSARCGGDRRAAMGHVGADAVGRRRRARRPARDAEGRLPRIADRPRDRRSARRGRGAERSRRLAARQSARDAAGLAACDGGAGRSRRGRLASPAPNASRSGAAPGRPPISPWCCRRCRRCWT